MLKPKELSVTNAELIMRTLSIGLGMAEAAKLFGVSKRTLERRVSENTELKSAKSRGRLNRKKSVLETLYKMATSGDCVKSTIHWLTHIDKQNDVDPYSKQLDDTINPVYEEVMKMTHEESAAFMVNMKNEIIQEYCMANKLPYLPIKRSILSAN